MKNFLRRQTQDGGTMPRNGKDDSQLNGLLDKGCSFEGKLMFDGTVQINGNFKGEILSDGTLVVGAEAQVNAHIQVDSLVIDGSVQGIVEAKRRVELRRGSRMIANISTPALVIEEGSIFHGQCQMIEETGQTYTARPQPKTESAVTEESEDSLMM